MKNSKGLFVPKHKAEYLYSDLQFNRKIRFRKPPNRGMLHAGRYLNDKEFSYLGTIKVMADVYLIWDTGHRSRLINKNLTLNHEVLITSRPMNQNIKPKRNTVKAKFIQTKSYEYRYKKANLIKLYREYTL